MNICLAISLVLAVTTVYLFLIEVFSVAFKLTGLATSKIRFQVASLFTGTGFTTNESELITNDKRRRKIALVCVYSGHVFSIVFMGLAINVIFSLSQMITNGHETPTFVEWYFIVLYVTSALFLLVLLIKIPPINKRFQKFLETIAINSSKKSRNTNIITVVDLYGKHAIAEVVLNRLPPYAIETPLFEMGLNKEYSINVLSIRRGARVIEVTKDSMFKKGDTLVIYGLINDIKNAFVNSLDENQTIVLDKTNEISLVNNYGQNALVEVYLDEVPQELDGIKMQDSHLTDRYHISIVVIKRKEGYIFPDRDSILQKGDTLTLLGPYKNIKLLFKNDDKE